ncbi:Prolyl endopeptidase [Dichanthelium oligosanthes]|uniref:Prolyl endopeptidase n=1 Tax=Dichanthelium oligosanthes TaxID=888268 RepID=A0A1E5UK66_9POAL|nr:Prolyl endopeptidase [Dichanthelium oligosanthes]
MGSLAAADEPLPPLKYPQVRRDDGIVDDYHGVLVPDPYRWMEELDSPEVEEFVDAQAAVADAVLSACDDHRGRLRRQLTALFDHPRFRAPFKRRHDTYFYFHNPGLRPHSALYVQHGLGGEPRVLLDPNDFSEDGTVSLGMVGVCDGGDHLAYGTSASGSDWVTIRVMRVRDGEHLPDTLSWVKFSRIAWTGDGLGFFYSRFPAPRDGGEALDSGIKTGVNLNHEVYYHFLGTEQSQDVLCWRDPDHPKYIYIPEVTEDGKYVILSVSETSEPVNKLYYCDLSALAHGLEGMKGTTHGMLPFVKLVDKFEACYGLIANDGTEFTFLTNKDAPRYKLSRVDVDEPESWTDVLPEDEKAVLESACAVHGDKLMVNYLSDVKYVLQMRSLVTGELLHDIPIDIGTVNGISGRRVDSEVFIEFASFLTPGIIYRCDVSTEVFYPSKDGTKIPMFIVSKKSLSLNGSHPALLFGYGGFGMSMTPQFSVTRVVLMRNLGFVACVANIRGGGEYGEGWHRAGSLANKQNCFDDFIAAGEFLVSTGYTNPARLCIEGGSNGGLLVAACMNQRPDLFGCALAHVGVMDMLRFHKFTIGRAWTCDFGCSENKEEFHWLIKYSPLHNVQRPWEKGADDSRCFRGSGGQYPPTLLLTADHDDRVVPSHTLKFLATMQHVLRAGAEGSPQTNPIIARIERKSGHGCGRSTQKIIDEAADRYAFAAKMMGVSWID